ncbi:MAG: DUF1844 domain-containing protein [Thermodesulfobacteriota bacterium]|nr:DUF1844 domain-containing protein [Thermodesulfobacteriota bacterium]
MARDDEDKGFKVTDRRHFAESTNEVEDDERKEATAKGGEAKKKVEKGEKREGNKREEQIPLPEMNFPTFIFSLNSSALFHLGEIPDPETNAREKNLPLAKQTIDIISMLKEKTKGNLTDDEQKFVDSILYDLRMRYVEATKKV